MFVRVVAALAAAGLMAGVSSAQKLQSDRVVAPDDSGLLAEGPLAVKVSRVDAKQGVITEEGTLLFLTREALYFRYPKTGEVVQFSAKAGGRSRGLALTIETTAPVTFPGNVTKIGRWRHDDKKTPPEYVGTALPPRAVDIDPLPGTESAEVNWFLYYALEQLQTRADSALAANDPRLIEICATRAAAVAKFMAEGGLDREVAARYATLPKYLEEQTDVRKRAADLLAEQVKKRQELFARAREAQSRAQARQALGLFGAFMSAMPDVEEREYADGTIVRYERYDASGVASGLATVYQAQMDYQRERQQLALAQAASEEGAKAEYTRLNDRMVSGRRDRWVAVRKAGIDRFGLPAGTPLDRLEEVRKVSEKAKDSAPVVALLEDRVKRDRGDGTRDNPYALWDLYYAKALAVPPKSPTRGAELFALAEKAAAAVRLVPPGAIFDFDRLELIRCAASLGCMAATAEAWKGSWALAYSPRAAFAVRLLDLAGPLDRMDTTGEAREQRAVALMLTGRADDALTQALAVADLRGTSSSFQFTLARLYGTNPNTRRQDAAKGLDALTLAFKYGYTDVAAVRENPDFAPLHYATDPQGKPRIKELLRLKVAVKVVPPQGPGGSWAVVVTNNSAFALTNVKLQLNQVARGKGGALEKLPALAPADGPVALLRPEREYRWEDKFADRGKPVVASGLVLECDQGNLKLDVK